MNYIKRKITTGIILISCLTAAIVTGSMLHRKASVLPVSGTIMNEELPVIVLDAGHGECS